MTEMDFDDTVTSFYKAAIGEQSWGTGLEKVRHAMAAQVVNIFGVVKETSAVSFSYEVGNAQPEAALDFIRHYHQIDPRAALLMGLPVGELVNCHRHFDDAFVAQSQFYQEFLIPYGGRYSAGLKIFEDTDQAVIFGVHRPSAAPAFDAHEEALIARLALHLQNAMATFVQQQSTVRPAVVGIELLQRMPQPLMVLTDTRTIVYSNPAAERLLERGDLLSRRGGLLCGRQPSDDAKLLIGLRALGLTAGSYLGNAPPTDKVFLRLQDHRSRIGIYLYAMHPCRTMGAFGSSSMALAMLHDPQASRLLDPFVVAATWTLTPAEAKVAVSLWQGLSATEIARQHGVSPNTVRTQIQSAMEKMGVSRQADLVRLLATVPPDLS